jgi:putative chitinase
MTLSQLTQIVYNRFVNRPLVEAINNTFADYEINTPLRQSHFLAQIIHESAAFCYTKEIASGAAYEGRIDLGNIHPGDGIRYKGRGYIQLTGRANYTKLSAFLGRDFLKQPELLEALPYAMLAAGWYWDAHKLNLLADLDDVEKITRKINGGLNGFADRKNWLAKCKEVLIEKKA